MAEKMWNELIFNFKQLPIPVGVFLEQILWSFGYLFIIELIYKSVCRAFLSTYLPKIWAKLAKEKGVFCSTEQEEVILTTAIGIQHCFAGGMVVYGAMTENADIVRHGILCESGWEMLDATFLLLGAGPCTFFFIFFCMLLNEYHELTRSN
jgi:hypothetical protein